MGHGNNSLTEAREEVERLARGGVKMVQISQTLGDRNLAPWEQDLLYIYSRQISDGSLSIIGNRYLASLEDEIGA
jgi:hypothetical protein